jgi:hypothetical protein
LEIRRVVPGGDQQTLVAPERVRRTIPSRPLEQVAAEDRFILAATHLTPIGDLADVEPVLEQMSERTHVEAEAYRSSPGLLAGTLFECQAQLEQADQLGHAGGTGCDSTRSRISSRQRKQKVSLFLAGLPLWVAAILLVRSPPCADRS